MTTIQIILLTLLSGLIMIDFMSAHLTVCNTITTGIVAGVIMGNPTLGLIVGATLQSYALGLNYFGALQFQTIRLLPSSLSRCVEEIWRMFLKQLL